MGRPVVNLSGHTFGRLTVIGQAEKRPGDPHAWWACQCSCGKALDVPANRLRSGNTASCGCSRIGRHWSRKPAVAFTMQIPEGQRARRRWADAEDKFLTSQWGTLPIHDMSLALKRTPKAVYLRAIDLGLKTGAPQGFVSVGVLGNKYGFRECSIVHVMRWAKAKLVRAYGPGHGASPSDVKATHWCVDAYEAERAMKAFFATETVRGAANARGMYNGTLYKWLAASGELKGRRYHKFGYRIPSEVIDRVVAEHRRAA